MKNPCKEIFLPIKIFIQRSQNKYHLWYGNMGEGAIHKEGTFKDIKEEVELYLNEVENDIENY